MDRDAKVTRATRRDLAGLRLAEVVYRANESNAAGAKPNPNLVAELLAAAQDMARIHGWPIPKCEATK